MLRLDQYQIKYHQSVLVACFYFIKRYPLSTKATLNLKPTTHKNMVGLIQSKSNCTTELSYKKCLTTGLKNGAQDTNNYGCYSVSRVLYAVRIFTQKRKHSEKKIIENLSRFHLIKLSRQFSAFQFL